MWIIANWKSNKNIAEALEWIEVVGPQLEKRGPSTSSGQGVKVVVCPEFTALSEVKKAVMVGNFPLMVGAQDLSPFREGAFTGEVPAQDIKELVELAILGHSERRKHFTETDEQIAQKVIRAKESGIIPLVCVQGRETRVPQGCHLIAYEPIFAIGTENPDTPQNANEIAGSLKKRWGDGLEVLYGGSVNPENVKAFVEEENIDGVLIGGASLDPVEFIKIIKICYGRT